MQHVSVKVWRLWLLKCFIETTGLTADRSICGTSGYGTYTDSGTTTASRQTVFTGEATRKASLRLKEMLETKTLEEIEWCRNL